MADKQVDSTKHETLDDPVESLKPALLDVKHGRVMSWEDFKRRMIYKQPT